MHACMCTHTHTQSWAVTAFYSCLIRKTDGVSVSSPAPKGCRWRLCICACVRLYDCRKNGEGAVVCLQRERKKRFPQECAWTHSHMSTHTHTAGGCQNVLQKLSCVQFSLLHPLCSFILSPPFIYLYPFAHPLIAQQPCSSSPLLLSFSPHAESGRKHSGCVPGSPLCMHSQRNANTKAPP